MTVDPTFAELQFHHPVSLKSASTVQSGAGLPILGYHFESDSIVGDFWLDGSLSIDEFLSEVRRRTGTAPEIVTAYVDGAEHQARSLQRSEATGEVMLGADLPVFDAPDAVIPADLATSKSSPGLAVRSGSQTWQPTDVQIQIGSMGSKIAIDANYSWWGLSPFAHPAVMADHWGMEFQVDFYTSQRPIAAPWPYLGIRGACGVPGDEYKDWAAASNRAFDWFGWVIAGTSTILAPGNIGLYGDYNDLSDPCTVSTIAVGAAQPQMIPNTIGSTNELRLTMYPNKGQDSTSVVGSIVQPVNRGMCESFPSMPLTDCMGVTPGTYPGPGPTGSRPVLNNTRGWRAPDLCWYSGSYGATDPQAFSCNGNDL